MPKSWNVPFFCSSNHSYWKMFIVLLREHLFKKFLMKSSTTTGRSTLFAAAVLLTIMLDFCIDETPVLVICFAALTSYLALSLLKSSRSSSLSSSMSSTSPSTSSTS